jgi:hypothetical protein
MKGVIFDTTEGIQKAVTDQLNNISAEDFSNAMKKLETRANLFITSNGTYLKQKKQKNFHLLFFIVFIALVRALLDRTVYVTAISLKAEHHWSIPSQTYSSQL